MGLSCTKFVKECDRIGIGEHVVTETIPDFVYYYLGSVNVQGSLGTEIDRFRPTALDGK